MHKKREAISLVQIILAVVIAYLFCLSIFFKFLVSPLKLLVSLLFFVMAYNYQMVFKNKTMKNIYIAMGILSLISFIVGVIYG